MRWWKLLQICLALREMLLSIIHSKYHGDVFFRQHSILKCNSTDIFFVKPSVLKYGTIRNIVFHNKSLTNQTFQHCNQRSTKIYNTLHLYEVHLGVV